MKEVLFHFGLAGLIFALITGIAIVASLTPDRRLSDVFKIDSNLLGGGNDRF